MEGTELWIDPVIHTMPGWVGQVCYQTPFTSIVTFGNNTESVNVDSGVAGWVQGSKHPAQIQFLRDILLNNIRVLERGEHVGGGTFE